MRGLLIRWIIQAFALGITALIVKGITIRGVSSLFIAALIIGILNAILRPIMLIMTLPLNIMTLGLFTFVINAIMLIIAGQVVPGFNVTGFWAGLVGAMILGLVSFFLNRFIGEKDRLEQNEPS